VLPEWKPQPLEVHMISPAPDNYARLHPCRKCASKGLLECSFGAAAPLISAYSPSDLAMITFITSLVPA
jgi:hypothetical protein